MGSAAPFGVPIGFHRRANEARRTSTTPAADSNHKTAPRRNLYCFWVDKIGQIFADFDPNAV